MDIILADMELPTLVLRHLLDTMEDRIPIILPMATLIQARFLPLVASDPASLNLLPMSLVRSAPLMEWMERKTSLIFHWHIPSGEPTAVLVTVP
jgi:hypothetical protein